MTKSKRKLKELDYTTKMGVQAKLVITKHPTSWYTDKFTVIIKKNKHGNIKRNIRIN